MSSTAHIISAILLLILITVMFGGFSFLWLLRDRLPDDQVWNFRAGHDHGAWRLAHPRVHAPTARLVTPAGAATAAMVSLSKPCFR